MKKGLISGLLLFCFTGSANDSIPSIRQNSVSHSKIYWRVENPISDLISSKSYGIYWTISGNGCNRSLVALDDKMRPIKSLPNGIKLKQSVNHNWSDLTISLDGEMALADFTDSNGIQPLIYIFDEPDLQSDVAFVKRKIVVDFPSYSYNNQLYTDMCPAGIFYRNNQLYLLSNGENGQPNIYKVDKDSGLTFHASLKTNEFVFAMESDGKDKAAVVIDGAILIYKPNYDLTDWILVSKIEYDTKGIVGVSMNNGTISITSNKGKVTSFELLVEDDSSMISSK